MDTLDFTENIKIREKIILDIYRKPFNSVFNNQFKKYTNILKTHIFKHWV